MHFWSYGAVGKEICNYNSSKSYVFQIQQLLLNQIKRLLLYSHLIIHSDQQVLACTISDSSLCCNRRSNGQISMLEPKEENIHTKAKVNSKYEIGGEIAERASRGWMRPTIKLKINLPRTTHA